MIKKFVLAIVLLASGSAAYAAESCCGIIAACCGLGCC
jgi:hypothetical protein